MIAPPLTSRQLVALAWSAVLAVAGAVAGLAGLPAQYHQIAELVLAIGGALGTSFLPAVTPADRNPTLKPPSE